MNHKLSEDLITIYQIVGEQPFKPSVLTARYQKYRHGVLKRLENEGRITCLQKRNGKQEAVYQISYRDIRRFRAEKLLTNPKTLTDLLNRKTTIRTLSRETGYSADKVKKLLRQYHPAYFAQTEPPTDHAGKA